MQALTNELTIDEIKDLFKEDAIGILGISAYLVSLDEYLSDYLVSIKALASAAEVYKLLPNATIALNVASRPLHRSDWTDCEDTPENPWLLEMSLPSTFACIALFESGSYNIEPSDLHDVFALSSGNSIFVATQLLCDPSEVPKAYEVRRVVGNIGRAGLAMLIPPLNPRIRKPYPEKWELINHAKFDGRLEDCFQNTSLRLSFTQFTMPISVVEQGGQDIEAFFIESVVSVHDREKWVADLDVLGTFRDDLLTQWTLSKSCEHPIDMPPPYQLIAIDNWEELLDRDNVPVVIRAHQNWMARLATAIVNVNLGHSTIIAPDKICWPCMMQWRDKSVTFIC